jgi:hypothetical protein
LLARVSHWNPDRWTRPAAAAGTRAEAFHALVQRLADLGAAAEDRAPRPVPRLENDLALPDQFRVMVDDLIRTGSAPHQSAATEAITRQDPTHR